MSEHGVFNLKGFHGMRLIRQAEAAECGLAYLGMVASAHGYKTVLPSLRRHFARSLKGLQLNHSIFMADQLGFGAPTL